MSENLNTQARYAYPKFKVYIFGIDVSADVVSIKASNHDGKAPNTCQITLQNINDRYIVNTDDIASSNNLRSVPIPFIKNSYVDDVNSVVSKPYGVEVSTAETRATLDPIKVRILTAKGRVQQNLPISDRRDPFGQTLETKFTDYYGETIKRYQVADGSSVFHPMDPVRVFMRDPFDPARWYHHFCGFVSDTVEQIGTNGEQEIMIQAEDPMKLLRYTRVFVNPGIVDARKVVQLNDLRVQSFNAHYMKGFDLPEVLFTSIFGPDRVGAEKLKQRQVVNPDGRESSITTRLRGIGHFSYDRSGIFTFGPDGLYTLENNTRAFDSDNQPTTKLYDHKKPINLPSLAAWQYLIDHEVQPSDLKTMWSADVQPDITSIKSIAKFAPDGMIDPEWVVDYIGSNPDLYLVDGGRIMMLIPNSLGTQNRNVVMRDIINSYPMNSEWQSVAEILYDLVDRLQFSLYCTPKGDLIVEPPLYDFSPTDFGMEVVVKTILDVYPTDAAADGQVFAEAAFPSRDRGPFGPRYVVTKRDTISVESAFTDDKVHTIAVMAKQIFPGWESLPNTSIVGDLAVVTLPDLVPIYGARQAPITHRNFVSTEEGAKLYANIVLNKLNSDAHTITLSCDSNLGMWVNRPIYIQKRNIISTIRRVDHSLSWGARGSMDTRLDLHATRSWSGKMDDKGMPIYDTIGGVGGAPLDYSVLFRSRQKPKPPAPATPSDPQSRQRIGA